MPNMASLTTVKKADESSDVTYDALTGAAGDGSVAVWRQDTGAAAGLPVGMRANLSFSTQWNGPRTARRAVIVYKRPYATLDSTTGRYSSTDQCVARMEFTIPQSIPASEINESVYQCLNALHQTLIKQSVAAGYAPQ